MLLLIPHSNCTQHANSFFPCSIRHWNKLPGAIANIENNDIFKAAVCDFLLNMESGFNLLSIHHYFKFNLIIIALICFL